MPACLCKHWCQPSHRADTDLVVVPCTMRSSTSAHCRSVHTPNVTSGAVSGFISTIAPVVPPAHDASLDMPDRKSEVRTILGAAGRLVSTMQRLILEGRSLQEMLERDQRTYDQTSFWFHLNRWDAAPAVLAVAFQSHKCQHPPQRHAYTGVQLTRSSATRDAGGPRLGSDHARMRQCPLVQKLPRTWKVEALVTARPVCDKDELYQLRNYTSNTALGPSTAQVEGCVGDWASDLTGQLHWRNARNVCSTSQRQTTPHHLAAAQPQGTTGKNSACTAWAY